MKRKQQPVMHVIAKAQEPVQPTLATDGRRVLDWCDPAVVWKPLDRFVASTWGRP